MDRELLTGHNVGQEHDLRRRHAQIDGNGRIAGGQLFGANFGVVVAAQPAQQVAVHGVAEQQLLGVNAAAGVDAHAQTGRQPGVERRRHIVEHAVVR